MANRFVSVKACVLLLALMLSAVPAVSLPIFLGGNGVAVYGVADYGAPAVPGAPTYIPNNFTGLNDVLTSPGNGFLTADTSIPNNIFQFGPGPVPQWSFKIGGGNANGVFGYGATGINASSVGFALQDINPNASGGAAYLIASWNSTFLEAGGFAGIYGNWLSIAGTYSGPASAGAVSLRTHITSNNPLSPFFGGVDLAQLVLAANQSGNNDVAIAGTAAVIADNGFNFRGLAVNRAPIVIPNGDTYTVTTTLTAIADPMFFATVEIDPNQLLSVGGLPELSLASTFLVPEPSPFALLGGGLLLLALLARSKSRTRFLPRP